MLVLQRFFIRAGLLVCGTIFSSLPTTSRSETLFLPNVWTLSGSVGAAYTDNVRFAPNNTVEDGLASQTLRLSYSGRTAGGFFYEGYGLGLAESYFEKQSSDNSLWGIGATFSQVMPDRSVVGINFEPKFNYRDFFEDRSTTVYDLTAFWTRVYSDVLPGLKIVPRFVVGNRWADMETVERWTVDARLTAIQKLTERWSFVSTSRVQYQSFYQGATAAPRDTILTQAFNLQYFIAVSDKYEYVFSPGVSFTNRNSNIVAREFDRWGAGPNIDFKIVF